MNHSNYFLILLFFLGLLLSCSKDPELIPLENLDLKILFDVAYGSDEDQVFDIYLPADRTFDTRMMLLVHGGGWSAGDKEEVAGFKDFIIEQNPDLAIVNINYRLANDITPPLPTQIDDITAVVNHLKDNQQTYQIGTQLGLLGVSAGAHLSLLWAYAHDSQDQVKMVCSVVGPTNLADDAYVNTSNRELTELFAPFGETIDELKNASPLFKVKSSSPPTILFYGAKDPLVPNSQGIDMRDRLEELQVEHEFTLYPNGGHGWSGADLLDTGLKLEAFIQKHLLD